MPQFRKKPVVIEARQYTAQGNGIQLARWCHGTFLFPQGNTEEAIYIPTLEGEMRADPGDWIIEGVKGEFFYPCKPDIFEATYEPAEAAP
jgi:hypothetical protein